MTIDHEPNPQHPPGMPGSRIFKKFNEKFAVFEGINTDLRWDEEHQQFRDPVTRMQYKAFVSGYMSHPSYGMSRVSIIGKVTEEGIEFAQQPRLHVNYTRAIGEAKRLRTKHKASFKVFLCMDEDEDLRNKAMKSYAKLMTGREEDRARNQASAIEAQRIRAIVQAGDTIELDGMSAALVNHLFGAGTYNGKKDQVSLCAVNGWGIVHISSVSGERQSFERYELVQYNPRLNRFEERQPTDLGDQRKDMSVKLHQAGASFEAVHTVFGRPE